MKRLEDRGLPRAAMVDQPIEARIRIRDRRAVAGVEHPPFPRGQFFAGRHEIRQITVGGETKEVAQPIT